MEETEAVHLRDWLAHMKDRGKPPHNAGVLDSWIDHAESQLGIPMSGRLRWLVATTVVTAMLQMVVDESENCRFALKGGSFLQHVLDLEARATTDLDGMVRGDLDDFIEQMDAQLLENCWGPFTFRRGEVEEIRVPGKAVKPRRFVVSVMLGRKTWRKVKVEVSTAEGRAGELSESFPAPRLDGFGIPTPDYLVGMAISYQAAQKIHGAAGFHEPESGYVNTRARDVVDVLLIRSLARSTGHPALFDIRKAAEDTFSVRGEEAQAVGRKALTWPPLLQAYSHWLHDYQVAASSVGLELSLEEAVGEANSWIEEIASAS